MQDHPASEIDEITQYPVPEQWLSEAQPEGLPTVPTDYPNLWATGSVRRGRPLLVAVLGVVGFLVLTAAMNGFVSLWASLRTRGMDSAERSDFVGLELIVVSYVANSIALVLLVPMSLLLSRLVGQRGRWLGSVAGRFRWGWFLQCAVLGAAVVVAILLLFSALVGEEPLAVKPGLWGLLVMVILLVPVQAVGVEYLLRGVLNRGVAALSTSPAVGAVAGAVVSSVLYVLMDATVIVMTGDVWRGGMWFLLGLVLSFVAWRTGGLEAGVVTASVYPLLSRLSVFVTGTDGLLGTGTNGPDALVAVLPTIVVASAIVLLASVRGVQRRTRHATVAEETQ